MSKTQNRKSVKPAKNLDKNVRTLVTPEGIDLRLRLADTGSRFGAFVIDITIMVISLIVMTLLIGFAMAGLATSGADKKDIELGVIIWILGFFLLRNFYFMFFEMGGKGATPGKRVLKIRVANRNGGHLTANAIFARNAMREIEFFMPLSFFFSINSSFDGWVNILAFIWSMIFLLFPLCNKDRLRAGDVIAGTWVVNAPRLHLSIDISTMQEPLHQHIFTPEQVSAYGVKELHVLENVLRQNNLKTLAEVTNRICVKIKWKAENKIENKPQAHRDFLSSYYAALRKKLENQLLFGVRREDKFDTHSLPK